MFKTIDYLKENRVGTIYLNRPSVHNAYNTTMRDELSEIIYVTQTDPEIAAIVIAGRGPDFCSGADLTEFGSAPSVTAARQARWERDLWGQLLNVQKPVLAAIQGHCIGLGIEMAMLCDLRIASEKAKFSMPEVGLGLIPAAGGTQTLPKSLRFSDSLQMLLTGQVMNAKDALCKGMINRVVCHNQLYQETMKLAQYLVRVDSTLFSMLKKGLWDGISLSLDQAMDLETRMVLKLVSNKSHHNQG